MKKKWISIIICCFSLQALAQQVPDFSWEAKLPVPDSTGYYHIAITPAVSARAYQHGGWDIRIYSGQTEVPYVLNQDFLKDRSTNAFKAFAMPLLEAKPNVSTTVIFEKLLLGTLSEFGLRYTNTSVKKEVAITGSNDKVNWYALRGTILLDPAVAIMVEEKSTILEQTITIPTSSYKYYKLLINDSASVPLQINCVGYRSIPQVFPAHTQVPGVTIKKIPGKNSRNDQYLVDLHDHYPLTHLTFGVKAPQMYHRDATLSISGRTLRSFIISSATPMGYVMVPQNETYDSIFLHIANGDNPPLELGEVQAWQNTYYLIAKLEKGKTYSLKGGSANMQIPQYDVEHFKDVYESLAQNMIQPEPPLLKAQPVPAVSATFFKSQWWVWAGILFIIVLLGLVVSRMLKDMKKEGK